MSKVRFVDNVPVSAYGSNNAASTATSASYASTATSASYASTASFLDGNAISASYATTASYALFAVSASHEIVKEVSSSHANTADVADVANGLQGQPSIYVTNITASGDISSSGTIITENGNVKNNLTVGGNLDIADTIYHTGDSNTKIRFPENDTIAFNTSGNERLRISPDGNISASNNLTINNITSSGDIILNEDQRIYFEADKNTYIESHASDSFRAVVNNRQMFLLDENTGNRAVFGNGTKVFIGANNNHLPSNQLEVSGSVSVLGGGTAGGHITASGNISASATSTASFGTYLGDGSQLSGITSINTGSLGNTTITGSLTVSGSGTLTNIGPFFQTGDAVITGSLIISGSNTGGGFFINPLTKLSIGGNPGETFDFVHTPAQNTGLEVLPQLLVISGSRALGENATIHIGSSNASTSNIGDNVVVRHALYVAGRFDHPNAAGNTGDERYAFAITGSDRNGTGGIISLGKKGTSLSGTAIHLNGHLTASAGVNISASATSTASFGTYLGDGSQLSNISTTPFPFSGSAVITGSLTVSGSGTFTNIGPFSQTGNSIFTGNITASANVSSSATSTASFGTYIGDGSQLSNISTTPFPFIGDAQITGSLTISGSFSSFTLDSANVVLGASSGTSMEAGADSNIIVGTNTATSLTTGDFNVILGDSAGAADTNAQKNVIIGQRAGGNSTGLQENIFIGNAAGRYGSGLLGNVGIGQAALQGTTNNNGDYNVGIGWQSGTSIEDGAQNVFIGYRSAEAVTTGNYNVVIGKKSGFELTTGANNVLVGPDAGNGVSTGNRNIAIGYSASFSGDVSDQLVIGSGSLATISASLSTGDVIFASTASADYFVGDGSQLTNLPASSTFPFTGDAQITGSLIVSQSGNPGLTVFSSGSTAFEVIGSVGTLFSVDDSLTGTVFSANDISGLPVLQADATGEVYLGKSPQSLYTTAVISATSASSTASVSALSTSSYDGAFFDYTITSASNARAGSIMSVWNGGNITFTETTTTDIGSTSGINFQVIISASQAQLVSITDSTAPNTWKVKTIIKAI